MIMMCQKSKHFYRKGAANDSNDSSDGVRLEMLFYNYEYRVYKYAQIFK